MAANRCQIDVDSGELSITDSTVNRKKDPKHDTLPEVLDMCLIVVTHINMP